MKQVISEEKVKELKRVEGIVMSNNHELTNYDTHRLIEFYNEMKGEGLFFSDLFDEDIKKSVAFINKIFDFCWKKEVNLQESINFLFNVEITSIKLLRDLYIKLELFEDNELAEVDGNELYLELHKRLDEVCDYANEHFFPNLKVKPEAFQEILNNSYDEILKRSTQSILNTKLPLNQYRIDDKAIVDEIKLHKEQFINIFTNKKSLAKIESGNHFLSYLRKDDFEITEDYKIVFKGHTKALSTGYTEKAILLSLDKDVAIRELQTKIKHLEDFHTEESQILINYALQLIEFIKQKRYANHILFKSLAKELGITKGQARNYAKKLFNINEKSFIDNFDNIKLLDK